MTSYLTSTSAPTPGSRASTATCRRRSSASSAWPAASCGASGSASSGAAGSASQDRYDPFTALSLIAFAYAGGITFISGAVFAGLISAQALFPYALQDWFGLSGDWFLLFGGVVLIFTLLQNPTGVAGDLYRRLHKKPQFHAPDVAAATRERITPRDRRPDLSDRPDVLAVDGLSVRFGGVHALSDVQLNVKKGELGVTEDDAKRTLALVGMDWAAEAEPSALSSGQRKLVGVSRALVAKPKPLCLDEPAAGLDTGESGELGVTLRKLADQGQSMLLIEHDMGLVLGICDRVVVLEFGKVIAEGTPEDVRRDPKVIAAYLGDGMESAATGDSTTETV